LSTRKKLLAKVKAVVVVVVEAISDAGRLDLDGCRAGGADAAAGYCTLTSPLRFFFASGLGLGVLLVPMKDGDDDVSLCSAGMGRDDDVASPADHGGILDGDPTRLGPNSGGERL
jgi:hypothetical protein